MVSQITAETMQHLTFDSGMLLKNFDFSEATSAEELAALIADTQTQTNCWLGATKGGINIQENKQYWTPEFDGKRMPVKGEKRFATAEPKITGTLVEFTPANVSAVSGAADIETSGNVVTVQPLASIREGDYFDNIVFVGEHGTDGLYVAELDNALCVSGVNSQTGDKDIGTLPFEFSGHAENVMSSEELPIRYYFFAAAGETAGA